MELLSDITTSLQQIPPSIGSGIKMLAISMTGTGIYRTIDYLRSKKEETSHNEMASKVATDLFNHYADSNNDFTSFFLKIALRIDHEIGERNFKTSPYLKIKLILQKLHNQVLEDKNIPNRDEILKTLIELIKEWTEEGPEPDPYSPNDPYRRPSKKKQRDITLGQKKLIDPSGKYTNLYILNYRFKGGLAIEIHIFEDTLDNVLFGKEDFNENIEENLFSYKLLSKIDLKMRKSKILDRDFYMPYSTSLLKTESEISNRKSKYGYPSKPQNNKNKFLILVIGGTGSRIIKSFLDQIQPESTTRLIDSEQALIKKGVFKIPSLFMKHFNSFETVHEQIFDTYLKVINDQYEKAIERLRTKVQIIENSNHMHRLDSSSLRSFSRKPDFLDDKKSESIFNLYLKYLREAFKPGLNEWESLRTFSSGSHSTDGDISYSVRISNNELPNSDFVYVKSSNCLRDEILETTSLKTIAVFYKERERDNSLLQKGKFYPIADKIEYQSHLNPYHSIFNSDAENVKYELAQNDNIKKKNRLPSLYSTVEIKISTYDKIEAIDFYRINKEYISFEKKGDKIPDNFLLNDHWQNGEKENSVTISLKPSFDKDEMNQINLPDSMMIKNQVLTYPKPARQKEIKNSLDVSSESVKKYESSDISKNFFWTSSSRMRELYVEQQ